MGRIKTSFVKRIALDLYARHASEFTPDFEKNKEVLEKLVELKSKKLRNVIAGYLTRLKRRELASEA
jgi:small subunit ribosomal protein S17e